METDASKHTLTASGRQVVSVQPQSLVEEDVMKPAGQVCVEFWQLHAHSNTSQHFVVFTDTWRCGGQSGVGWRAHSSFLQTEVDKRWRETCQRPHGCVLRFMSVCMRVCSNITESVHMSYRTRVQADIPLGFSGPQPDRPHSGARQADHSSPDHTLKIKEWESVADMWENTLLPE